MMNYTCLLPSSHLMFALSWWERPTVVRLFRLLFCVCVCAFVLVLPRQLRVKVEIYAFLCSVWETVWATLLIFEPFNWMLSIEYLDRNRFQDTQLFFIRVRVCFSLFSKSFTQFINIECIRHKMIIKSQDISSFNTMSSWSSPPPTLSWTFIFFVRKKSFPCFGFCYN